MFTKKIMFSDDKSIRVEITFLGITIFRKSVSYELIGNGYVAQIK